MNDEGETAVQPPVPPRLSADAEQTTAAEPTAEPVATTTLAKSTPETDSASMEDAPLNAAPEEKSKQSNGADEEMPDAPTSSPGNENDDPALEAPAASWKDAATLLQEKRNGNSPQESAETPAVVLGASEPESELAPGAGPDTSNASPPKTSATPMSSVPPRAPLPPDAGRTMVVPSTPAESGTPAGRSGSASGTGTSASADASADATEVARRTHQIDAEAANVSSLWVHPVGSLQVNTTVLHRVRAILNLYPHVSQSGICRATGISQGILSHYMHGRYRGNQDSMEEKLEKFVTAFLAGEHDGNMRAKPGPTTRPRSVRVRGRGRVRGRPRTSSEDRESAVMKRIQQKQMQTRYEVHQRLAAQETGDQSHSQNAIREKEFQRAQQIQLQLQHQQRMQHQMQQQGQHLGQHRVQQQQQQYMQQQQQQQQKQQQQQQQQQRQRQQHYQQQQYLMQQQRVAHPQQPTVQPLAPSVAVERAYHAYHSAKWAGSRHGAESLLLPIEICVETAPEAVAGSGKVIPQAATGADNVAPETTADADAVAREATTGANNATPGTDGGAASVPADAGAKTSDNPPMTDVPTGQSATFVAADGDVEMVTPSEPSKKLSHSLHYFTQWDVNERHLSPEEVAIAIVESSGCVPALIPKVSAQIRRRLFEAGVACPVPPEERAKENLRLIRIRVVLGDGPEQVLTDSFEWDLCAGDYNSPELFAQHLCADAGFSQFHVPKVAQEIRRQVALAQAISYGDAETKALALARLPEDHPLREPLPAFESAIRRMSPEEIRAKEREENITLITAAFMEPLLHDVVLEAEKRAADRAREAAQKALRESEEKKRREALAEAERKRREFKAALMERDANVHRVKNDHDIDLQPYLQLQLGRGVRPSVWLEGILIRKKRGLPIMPAVQARNAPIIAATTTTVEPASSPAPRPRGRPRKNPDARKTAPRAAAPRQGTKRRASAGSASRAQTTPETPRRKRGPPRKREDPSTAPVERRRRSSTRGSQPAPKRSRK